MRFRAVLNNPVGLYKIAQTLEKLGPSCIICFGHDALRFIKHREYDGGIQAWIKTQPSTLFSNYRVESTANNEISMAVQLDYLLRATRAAQSCSDIRIQLRRKGDRPFLEWTMVSIRDGENIAVGQEVNVTIIPRDRMRNIKEPSQFGTPDAYVMLPSLHSVKSVAGRLKSLGRYLTLSANMAGTFKMAVETELAQCETVYRNLENPRLEGHSLPEERDRFASVRISTDDFVSFINCYHLEPQNVICAITDDIQVVFYVYVNLDAHQTAGQQAAPATRTIMTCHVPVYYD